jgi:hypothetical protein
MPKFGTDPGFRLNRSAARGLTFLVGKSYGFQQGK